MNFDQARIPTTPRRVSAPPLRTPQHSLPSSRNSDGVVETLFNHPYVKIVAFSAGARGFPLGPSGDIISPAESQPGTLQWSSQLERTIAVGPFRIYRAPGSVAFLNCGSALQPILPKSQCWCIDEVSSKFILQIRRPQFWRIEIPTGETENDRRALLLRDVLDQVLQFEKTPCPFSRSFTVELPERPQTPVKKRPWTPVRRPNAHLPPTPVTPVHTGASLRTTRKSQNSSGGLEITSVSKPPQAEKEGSVPVLSFLERIEQHQDPDDIAEHGKAEDGDELPSPEHHPPLLSTRLSSFKASRCVTAPPQLSLRVAASAIADDEEASTDAGSRGSTSPTGSSDSFRSISAWHSPITPLPPSPPASTPSSPTTFPYPHENIDLPRPNLSHRRDASDATVIPEAQQGWLLSPTGADIMSLDSSSDTSSVYEDAANSTVADGELPASEITSDLTSEARTRAQDTVQGVSTVVTPQPRIRHRATTSNMSVSTQRAFSPLPPAANLFTPYRQYPRYNNPRRATTRMEAIQRIPSAIISKTCEILLSPPSHLFTLMLNVAARIAAGEWRGVVFGTGDGGEKIPVHWDYSDEDVNGWGVDGVVAPSASGQDKALGQDTALGEDSPSWEHSGRIDDDREGEEQTSTADTEWSRSWEVD